MIWKLTNDKDWTSLEKRFSWINDMQYVEQHSIHHAEGNVAIHTQMVIDELQKLDSFKQLSNQEKEILWASALLHDVEKRSTSENLGNGIISAHGHAKKGEYTARSILFKEVPTPFYIREQIATLVRFHGFPLWFMEKPDPLKKTLEIALRVKTTFVKMLSEADVRGRFCEDEELLLNNLKLFEMFCIENNCWGMPKLFKTDNARYHYFNVDNSYVNYVPFDNFRSEVILLSGLLGMGKDYYIEQCGKDVPIISLDFIRRKHKISPTDKSGNGRVVQMAKEEARSYLRKGQSFIWNATNITKMMRKQLIDLFVAYGAKVKIVYIEKPYDIWLKQNRNRDYAIPQNELEKMLLKLEIPQLTEAHEVEYLIED